MQLVQQHTERFTRDSLNMLFNITGNPCISIYMPAHKISSEAVQDPIRLKNLLRQAEEALAAQDYRKPEIEHLLDPMKALLEDTDYWNYQSNGLALFRTYDIFEQYRLPQSFEELVVVNDRLHIKPLLPLLASNGRFYLLALSQNEVRFFEGTRFRIGDIDLGDDTPTSLAEAMRFDDFESQLQSHTRTSQRTADARNAMFYGMSDAGDEAVVKENIKRFLKQVDNGIVQHAGNDKLPLILAGVEYMQGLYREVSQYDPILEDGIDGNPEEVDLEMLHAEAWSIVKPHFQQEIAQDSDRFMQLHGNEDERAATTIDEIVSSAYFQRIDTLFVPVDVQQWGTFDPERNVVELHAEKKPADNDLLDFAATHTLLNGGTVYALESEHVPGGASVAAIYRY